MYLAGDIGGTNTRLALFDRTGDRPVQRAVEVFASGAHASLEEIVTKFRATHAEPLAGATFAIAGPVIEGVCKATNLPWHVQSTSMAELLGLPRVGLLNDLAANALGVQVIDESKTLVVSPGETVVGNAVVISPGTGLGEAGLVWNGRRHVAVPSEGGHTDFAPRTELEIDLLRFLQERFGRVSYERIVSGPGLVNIYEFLHDTGRVTATPAVAEAVSTASAPAVSITEAAIDDRCPLCRQTLDVFLSVFGAEAGNLALTFLATGGVWLGGGIMAAIGRRLDFTSFRAAFTDKGRLSPMLDATPVRVMLEPHTALLGAAWHALSRAEGR
jgi:glucokinase